MSATAQLKNNTATIYDLASRGDPHASRAKERRPEIQLTVGERPRVTDEVFDIILKEGDLYNYGSKLSYLDNGKAVEVVEEFVADYLERHISFFKMKPTRDGDFERVTADTPGWLSKRVCKLSKQAIPELVDIITAPTLRPDGSILNKPGYDPDTKLLLLPSAYPEIPESPTMEAVKEAWETLWFPFSLFPYVSPDDAATAIACALTATIRKTLKKAPGFNFDAAMPSSGKTLLASISQELLGRCYVYSHSNDTELKKTITAILRDGYPVLLLDNIRGVVDSPAMEALLASETWCDRVLGVSTMFDGPSRILTMCSGNNFQPGGDLWRRMMNCRIDPKLAKPEARAFKFCPQEHTRENRQKIVAAALTILRGFQCNANSKPASDPLSSFEDWDKIVRQCVIWLGKEKIALVKLGDKEPAPLGDPVKTIYTAKENDPKKQRLSAFLKIVHRELDGKSFTSKELIEKGESISKSHGGFIYPAINNILLEVATHKSSNCFSTKVLGHWMGKSVHVRCEDDRENHRDSYWLEREKYDDDGNQRWIVKKAPDKNNPGKQPTIQV